MIEFNKSNNNPFKGLQNCLTLQQNPSNVTKVMLDKAWAEVKESKEARELFFSLLFSIGDITNRQHNIFGKKKIDGGGNAERHIFELIFNWLWVNTREQFIKFLNAHLFNEYSCFDILFKNRVSTKKNTTNVLEVYSVFSDKEYSKVLLDYVYSIINGNSTFDKMLVAKFLTIPRLSKRKGHKKLLDETKKIMQYKQEFLVELSKMMGWEVEYLKGYRNWRKQYNGNLESVLFTTGKINDLTKDEFLKWFDQLPAQARFRVKNRILYSMKQEEFEGGAQNNYKWAKFQPWLKEWETFKENKQQEQRVLEEKVRQGQASAEDKVKLEKVKKEAKVTTGAVNFKELYESISRGNVDKLKLEAFIQNKVNLPYNSLVIIDDSGSMHGESFNVAKFIASVCLVKNPDDDARNLIGFFNTSSHWHAFIDKTSTRSNNLLRNTVAQTNKQPLVDPTLSFYDNYKRISSFCDAVFRGGGTHLISVIRDLVPIVRENPEMLDTLKNYPIWTIVSDGDINSSYSAKASIIEFFNACENAFGFKPYLVLIDVANARYLHPEKFEGIDNFMYIPGNIAQIEQFLVNFKDMEVMDVYQSLQALHRSNRYEIVRNNTL